MRGGFRFSFQNSQPGYIVQHGKEKARMGAGRESNEAHNAEVLGRGEGGLDEGGMERREQI